MPRRLITLAVLVAALLAPSGASAAPGAGRVVVVFVPRTHLATYRPSNPTVLDALNAEKSLALGLVSETQGSYEQAQALLDYTAGARTSQSTYHPTDPPHLRLVPSGSGGFVAGFPAAVKRAATAPADIFPGLLARSVPGGVAYVGVPGNLVAAPVAADERGRIAAVSLGSAAGVPGRVRAALATHRLVVAEVPERRPGLAALHAILAARTPSELVIVTQTPPVGSGGQLSPIGVAGLSSTGTLTSETTHRQGIVAAIDLLPTVLRHLGLKVPDSVKGEPMTASGTRNASGLRSMAKRLSVIGGRRLPALETLAFAWLAVILVLGLFRDRDGVREGMRWGGLALLWLLTTMLITALPPHLGRTPEMAILAAGSFGLAALTDRFVPWPRAPAVPALVGLLAYAVDLARNSHLIVRSLLGPNPRSGSRFYGIGNELEIALTVLLLVGVAAAVRARERSNRGAAVFAVCGLVVAAIIASGRLGADVGGVFTVGGGTAVAVLLMLPGGVTRRAVAIAILVPFAGVGLLALLDTVTGGDGHFTRTVLHAHGVGDLWKTFERRTELAWHNLRHGVMPEIAVLCLLAGAYAIRYRRRVYGSLASDPVWVAGIGGAFAAGIIGSLTNDSGPLLLVIGTAGLAAVTAYLRGGEPALTPVGLPAARASAPASATPEEREREPVAPGPG